MIQNSALTTPTIQASTGILTYDQLPKLSFGGTPGFGNFTFDGGQIQSIKTAKKRALAKHDIPDQDADLLEDMGMHSASITIDILYVNGCDSQAFPVKYQQLQALFTQGSTGYLTLPSGEQYYCQILNLTSNTSIKHRDGVDVQIEFLETLNIGSIKMPSVPSTPSLILPNLSTTTLSNISFDNLNNMFQVNDLYSQITAILSDITIGVEITDNLIASIVGKLQTILSFIDLIDEELAGVYAYVRINLQDLLFQWFQKIQVIQSNINPQSQIQIYSVQQPTTISQICRRLNISIEDFYTLNPGQIGSISLNIGEQILYRN